MGKIKHIPIIGTKYGQWEVISEEIKRHSEKKGRTAYFKVRCKCGQEGWRAVHTLIEGTTKSCKSCAKTANNINTFVLSYFNKSERRATIANLEFNITPIYLENLFIKQDKKCALSGVLIEFKPNYLRNKQSVSLDRIDNTKGYVIDNVQWVHKDVNFMKGVMKQEDFINMCKLISENNK